MSCQAEARNSKALGRKTQLQSISVTGTCQVFNRCSIYWPHGGHPYLGCCLDLPHALQILRRLLVFGFNSDAKTLQAVPAVAATAPQLLAAVSALQGARPPQQQQGNGSGGGAMVRGQLLAMLDRGMLKLIKTLSQVQQEHPW